MIHLTVIFQTVGNPVKKLSLLLLLVIAGGMRAMDVTEYVERHGPVTPLGRKGALVVLSARGLTSLKGLAAAVPDPTKIKTVKAHWNEIGSVEPEDLAPFTQLKHLVLSHNPIVKLQLDSATITKIKLKHCDTEAVVGYLPKLEKLVVDNLPETDLSGVTPPQIKALLMKCVEVENRIHHFVLTTNIRKALTEESITQLLEIVEFAEINLSDKEEMKKLISMLPKTTARMFKYILNRVGIPV